MPRILLVEADEGLCALLAGLAPDADIVIEASHREAVRLLTTNTFDVIVSDYRLKDGTGVDVLVASRRASPGARRMLMTAQ